MNKKRVASALVRIAKQIIAELGDTVIITEEGKRLEFDDMSGSVVLFTGRKRKFVKPSRLKVGDEFLVKGGVNRGRHVVKSKDVKKRTKEDLKDLDKKIIDVLKKDNLLTAFQIAKRSGITSHGLPDDEIVKRRLNALVKKGVVEINVKREDKGIQVKNKGRILKVKRQKAYYSLAR